MSTEWRNSIDDIDFQQNGENQEDLLARDKISSFMIAVEGKLNSGQIEQDQFNDIFDRVRELTEKQDAELDTLRDQFISAKNEIVGQTQNELSQEKIKYLKDTFPKFTNLIA